MSKQTQTLQKQTQTSEDFFDVYKQNVEKYFENAIDSVPQNLQSLTDIQSEWLSSEEPQVLLFQGMRGWGNSKSV